MQRIGRPKAASLGARHRGPYHSAGGAVLRASRAAPGPALTVTFLVPVFGILWGHLFLGEPVGWDTLLAARR